MSGARSWRTVLGSGLLGFVAAVAVVLGSASTVWAATAGPALRLVAEPAPHDSHAVELLATIQVPAAPASSKSASLAGAKVSFSVHVIQFAGAPLLALGTATTNAAGVATLTYRPTWSGRQALVATAANTAGTTLASATTSFAASNPTHPFAGTVEALRPDGTIGQAVAAVLLAIVAVLWITLIAVVVRVNLGLAARREQGA